MVGTLGAGRREQRRRPGCACQLVRCVQLAALATAVLHRASAEEDEWGWAVDPEEEEEEEEDLPPSVRPYELPFPYMTGELAAAFQLDGLPRSLLDTLLDDALQLHAQSALLRPGVSERQWQPKTKPRRFSIEQFVEVISRIDFPDGVPNEIDGAEYWVEVRKNGGRENGLLFDKDVGYAASQQQMRFPTLSTMTFLTDGGAPTVVFNRTTDLTGSQFVPAVPSQGYLTRPVAGKHLRFNSREQHGLLGEACSSGCDEDVVVLRINWWSYDPPEPPYCKRLTKKEISQAGYTVFEKEKVQQLKNEISQSKPARAVQSVSLLAQSPSTMAAAFVMPPVRTNDSSLAYTSQTNRQLQSGVTCSLTLVRLINCSWMWCTSNFPKRSKLSTR